MKHPILCLCVLLFLPLTACEPLPTASQDVSPAPTDMPPHPVGAIHESPAPSSFNLPDFPVLVAENDKWTVCMDAWDWTEADGSVIDLSIYDREGTLFQKLRSVSGYTSPNPRFLQEGNDSVAAFEDLNFDGTEDLRVVYETIRCGAYDAFLWDEEAGKFIEEATFTAIKRPTPMNGLIFGNCSGGASDSYYCAYGFSGENGYQLVRDLTMDWVYEENDQAGSTVLKGIWYTETSYRDGRPIKVLETWNYSDLDGFWEEYNRYDANHIIKIEK